MVKKDKIEKKGKCCYMPGIGILAIICATFSIYFLVKGFIMQINLPFWSWETILYYLLGVLLMGVAKMSRYHITYKCDIQK